MMYRQGDVLLVKENNMPSGQSVTAEHGRMILARGEATGHHHSLAVDDCELITDMNGTMWLRTKRETPLEHQEHAAIPIPAGIYRVVQQREYTPEAIRNVQD